eukprot:GHUV01026474.1.p1 GENE.GHUV01026474.1~~GHUV01026474.1.p1  ORF type:complete len:248 (+),score=73.76 GHUV01026474.1:917-1660(+)
MEESYFEDWRPTLIICIAAGGFVPTRILRSFMKAEYGCNIPIQTIGLQLYDLEGRDPATSPVERIQWLSYGTGPGQVQLQGHRILLVDEVDDSRKTLAHAVSELEQDIEAERLQQKQSNPGQHWQAPELGVFVLHNKLRPKLAELPSYIMNARYWAFDIDNCWCVYPWDAMHIYDHTQTAEAIGLTGCRPHKHERRQSSGCPPPLQQQQLEEQDCTTAPGEAAAAANGHVAANGCILINGLAADGHC